jgi:signal transduction histidine kinase
MTMKLQSKVNIKFLLILVAVFSITGVILYFVLGMVVDRYIDDMLKGREKQITQTLQHFPEKALIQETIDQSISIRPINNSARFEKFTDTSVYDNHNKEYNRYRKLRFTVNAKVNSYEIAILLSRIESEDMIEVICWFMAGLFALIMLILYMLNQWSSSSVWEPFYKALDKIKIYKIGETKALHFDKSNIYEFDQMNLVLSEMIRKLEADFINLKDFTENAAHEMQTPLAVIKSKLEMILQDKSLSAGSYAEIGKAFESANKLSKLNETLLLLSKIENQQFVEVTDTDLCKLINQQLAFIEELIILKKITVIEDLKTSIKVRINPYLAEILINNLLSNALKHNYEGGEIIITSSDRQIIFSNSGNPLTIDPEKLFQRFVKQNTSSDSTGLGLAIASEICKNYNLTLHYSYQNGFHKILLLC